VIVFSSLRYAKRSPFIFLCTLFLATSSSIYYSTYSTCFFKLLLLYAPLFTFHNSISGRYKCVNSHQNSLFEFICGTLKEKKFEPHENQRWTGDAAENRKCKLTRFKLLQICFFAQTFLEVFEFLQHVARIVTPHHTRSNNLHSSLCCAMFVIACGQVKQHVLETFSFNGFTVRTLNYGWMNIGPFCSLQWDQIRASVVLKLVVSMHALQIILWSELDL
jgi:hypothetical protein